MDVEHISAQRTFPPFVPTNGIDSEFTDDIIYMDELCDAIIEAVTPSSVLPQPSLLVIAISLHWGKISAGKSNLQAIQIRTSDKSIVFRVCNIPSHAFYTI